MCIESLCATRKKKIIQRIRGGSDVDEFEDENAANAEDQYSGLQSDKDEVVKRISNHFSPRARF